MDYIEIVKRSGRIMMSEAEATSILAPYIEKVRIGSFISVYQDEQTWLKTVAGRTDYLGAQGSAILAESLDQVGKYPEVRQYADYNIGLKQLDKLEAAIEQANPVREVVRGHAWLVLQCGVSEFRRDKGHTQGLDLLNRGIEIIARKSGKVIDSQHIQSLFYFWRARILSTALYDFPNADLDFKNALSVADQSFAKKLREAELADPATMERKREWRTEVAVGAHVLSTILSFGLAQARQQDSKLSESLWFLRAAVPLSRTSTDLHRRGFAHLLMGTALRGIAQMKDLAGAEEQLKTAQTLLEQPVPHELHLARLYHQVALLRYNLVPPGVWRTGEYHNLLDQALHVNRKAADKTGGYGEFKDHLLEYGIKVVQSLIETARGNFGAADRLADEAITTISPTVPRPTHGWALVAKGMALAESVEQGATSDKIQNAERALRIVADDTALRATDRAAALLHLSRMYARTSQRFKAETHFAAAEPLVKNSEHGWLKDLAESAKPKEDSGPELRVDLEDMLAKTRQAGEKPWKSITRSLETDLKKRFLAMDEIQKMLTQSNGEEKAARALGITRATLFNWKKEEGLKEFFVRSEDRKGKPRSKRLTP